MTTSDRPELTRRTALRGATGVALGVAGLAVAGAAASAQSATPSAGAQMTQMPALTVDGALAVMQAALAKAREIGVPEVVAVVDAAGNLKAFARMDGSPNSSIVIAQDKAFTSASFHAPTDQLAKGFAMDAASLGSFLKLPHISLLAGGYPIMSGQTVIGAVGCSGGTGAQDQQCSQAGLAALTT